MEQTERRRGGAARHRLERRRLLGRAVGDRRPRTSDGNVAARRRHRRATRRNCYVRADGRLVAVVGLDDLVVVETADAVLVAHTRPRAGRQAARRRSSKADGRTERPAHRTRAPPLGLLRRASTRRALPGQAHHGQAGRASCRCRCTTTAPSTGSWCSGTARVTRGDETHAADRERVDLHPARHDATGWKTPARCRCEIIEVQSGAYLGEDDIVRFEDTYGRA